MGAALLVVAERSGVGFGLSTIRSIRLVVTRGRHLRRHLSTARSPLRGVTQGWDVGFHVAVTHATLLPSRGGSCVLPLVRAGPGLVTVAAWRSHAAWHSLRGVPGRFARHGGICEVTPGAVRCRLGAGRSLRVVADRVGRRDESWCAGVQRARLGLHPGHHFDGLLMGGTGLAVPDLRIGRRVEQARQSTPAEGSCELGVEIGVHRLGHVRLGVLHDPGLLRDLIAQRSRGLPRGPAPLGQLLDGRTGGVGSLALPAPFGRPQPLGHALGGLPELLAYARPLLAQFADATRLVADVHRVVQLAVAARAPVLRLRQCQVRVGRNGRCLRSNRALGT
jgi:hypothetical protein